MSPNVKNGQTDGRQQSVMHTLARQRGGMYNNQQTKLSIYRLFTLSDSSADKSDL